MKLFHLVILNIKYMINKKTIIFFSISILIYLMGLLYIANAFSSRSSRIMYHKEYYDFYISNSTLFLSFLIMIFSIFLSCLKPSYYDDYLVVLFSRKKVFITRIISLSIILLFYYIFIFLLFILIGLVFLPDFVISSIFINLAILFFIQAYYSFLLGFLFFEIFNNVFSSFIFIFLYWFMRLILDGEKNPENNILVRILEAFYPVLISENNALNVRFLYGNFYVISLVILILVLSFFFYCEHDFNNSI